MKKAAMSTQAPQPTSPPSQSFSVFLALIVSLSLVLPGFCAPFLRSAQAAQNTVSLWKTGNINYSDGAWNAHIFQANDGEGPTTAYCVEPAKNSPAAGSYTKTDIRTPSGRDYELRSDLWFAFGGPGFNTNMWPALNWNGDPMSDEDYYLSSHILLADTYSSNAYESTHGAGENFRNWIAWNITGFDLYDGHLINPDAVGQLAYKRGGEVPANFEAYQIDGSNVQTIAASSAYKPLGTIKMNKRSANHEITDGNPNYSLEGITYGVYNLPDCSEQNDIGRRLVLDKDGYAQLDDLYAGSYYVREIEASVQGTGYAYDSTVYPCEVKAGQVSWVHDSTNAASDADQNDICDEPITWNDVLIQKHDMLTHSSEVSGDADLTNALFEVRYFANPSGNTAGNATRTWVLRTDEQGKVDLRTSAADTLVSGDALFRHPESGEALFPLGTYAIRELSAPPSYELPTDGSATILLIRANGSGEHDVSGNVSLDGGLVVEDPPVRHDLSFIKRDMDTQRPMDNIPFLVSRIGADGSTIERHVVVTDANGMFDSAANHALHTTRTNQNDAALQAAPDGTYSVDESKLDYDAGVWFGTTKNGGWIAPDDKFGAFPDSTANVYRFEELPVRANAGKALVQFEAFAHAAQSSDIDLGTVGNTTPTLATSASDERDGDKLVSMSPAESVRDSISYSGLVAGRSYTIHGKLLNAKTGEAIFDNAGNPSANSMTFAAQATSGTIEMSFPVDTLTLEDGTRIVLVEELFEQERLLASHTDLADSAQTVTVTAPRIETTATDARDEDSIVMGDIDACIDDKVTYSGLIPHVEYVLEGVLVDRATGNLFEQDGEPVYASHAFVPDSQSGSTNVRLSFDASGLEPGTELVVFETLSQEGITIASHEDLTAEGQTVTVFPPVLKTSAHDLDDGDSVASAHVTTAIVDTVSYSGLSTGYEYELVGSLVDKQTGQPVRDAQGALVTSSQAFVAQNAEGVAKVILEFDASHLDASRAYVVFEELYRNGKRLAKHVDLDSSEQTVIVDAPVIQTSASSDGESRQIMRDKNVTIRDAVAYRNLKAGCTYRLMGTLMDKETGKPLVDANGNALCENAEFTAERADGIATLSLSLDASAYDEGTQIVVFEKLFFNDVEIASHEDIDDTRQTVTIASPSIATMASTPDGSKSVVRGGAAQIIDQVEYTGLAPNCAYMLEGMLMDKPTGEPFVTQDGDTVTSQVEFTPDHADGSVPVSFSFDSSSLAESSELVVFETLYRDGVVIASHEDLSSEEQTVSIVPPAIETYANDPADGDKIVLARESSGILDSVRYTGLEPGAIYNFIGTLWDKDKQCQVEDAHGNAVVAQSNFTPEAPDGVVEVMFEFDATDNSEERELVVMQDLYRDGTLIATHGDYDNSAQTVTLSPPHIETLANNPDDGSKEISNDGISRVVDTVSFTGLTPGLEYELDGSLMLDDGTLEGTPLRDGFGNPVTAHMSFTPRDSHGDVELTFEFDATALHDKDRIVAYERLFCNRALLTEHTDIQDDAQAVLVVAKKPTVPGAGNPEEQNQPTGFLSRTGDRAAFLLALCAAAITGSFGILAFLRRKAFGSWHELR